MLVAVDPDRGVEVDHGLQADVGVAEELGEGLDEHRTLALDARDPGLAQQGGVGRRGRTRCPCRAGRRAGGSSSRRAGSSGGPGARAPTPAPVVRLVAGSVVGDSSSCSVGLVCSRSSWRRSAGRASQPSARERSSSRLWSWPWVSGEDVGDPVEQRVEPGGVAGGDAGDDPAVAVLVAAGQGGVAAVPLDLAAHRVGLGVGLDDLGLGDLQDRGGGVAGDARATARSTSPTRSAGRARDSEATLRATQGSHARSATRAQVRGQAVLQVEGVGDQGAGGGRVGLAGHGQLGHGVLPDRRGALAAGLRSSGPARRPARRAARPSARPPASPRPRRPAAPPGGPPATASVGRGRARPGRSGR